jgi:hypothetical protein
MAIMVKAAASEPAMVAAATVCFVMVVSFVSFVCRLAWPNAPPW